MNDEGLLDEVEDLLRNSPPQLAFMEQDNDEVLSWLGRAAAVLTAWDPVQSVGFELHISALQVGPKKNLTGRKLLPLDVDVERSDMILESVMYDRYGDAYRGLRTLLFQAQHDLLMKTVGPRTVAIPEGMPFDYFDEIRKITEMARDDLLFVDPYLDSEFVSRYLRPITSGVAVRLLTSKKLSSLLPAVETLVTQTGLRVEVRSVPSGLHDRYLFLDRTRCYQSGASFKDGAKRSLTTLTQITDAFEAMFQAYERMWGDAKIEQG